MSHEWRAARFLLGLGLIGIAVAAPMVWEGAPLTVHMAQHLLLMSLAPPLIWLAAPTRVLPNGLRSRIGKSAMGRLLGHPVVCWVTATTVLVTWHVPALLTLGMSSRAWQAIEHLSFLSGGLLFWWPVVQPWPTPSTEARWSIVLYLFMATLPCDVLSGLLVFSERIVYPMSSSAHRHTVLSVLDDQQLAGALMWTAATIIYLVAGVIVATRSLSRNGVLVDVPSAQEVTGDLLRKGLVP